MPAAVSETPGIHRFGIRHHGPGSARSLFDALIDLQPDCILIEGPPEADALLRLVIDPEMKPPVALLAYSHEDTRMAAFYPFAVFSPEWQAIRFALERSLPVRFIDLPQSNWMAYKRGRIMAQEKAESLLAAMKPGDDDNEETSSQLEEKMFTDDPEPLTQETSDAPVTEKEFALSMRNDPLSWLAKAAGYSDSERWWEHMVEQRTNSQDLFAAIGEAMTSLRAELPQEDELDKLREAHMRVKIRAAKKEGFRPALPSSPVPGILRHWLTYLTIK